MISVTILGATGSIGRQALDVIARYPDRFRVLALTAGSNAEALFALARQVRPQVCALVVEPQSIPEDLRDIEWFFGEDASARAAALPEAQYVLASIVGMAGLKPVWNAIGAGRRLLLANKEALVTGGTLVMDAVRRSGCELIPVDSEHSAIFQCLQGRAGNAPRRLILTASGGALRDWDRERIDRAQVEEVLRHPNWKMGPKLTVDCASLMNKGLEVIEAHHLFGMPLDDIDVTIHPQSVIHSMVEFHDGAVLAQMGAPDMREAIGYALGYPMRLPFGGERLDFASGMALQFGRPDEARFPCLHLAIEAQSRGGVYPIALNAANEVAVGAFLRGEIRFGGIYELVSDVLNQCAQRSVQSIEDVLCVDQISRARAYTWMDGRR